MTILEKCHVQDYKNRMSCGFKKCTTHRELFTRSCSDDYMNNEVNCSDDDGENCANVAKVLMNADRGWGGEGQNIVTVPHWNLT